MYIYVAAKRSTLRWNVAKVKAAKREEEKNKVGLGPSLRQGWAPQGVTSAADASLLHTLKRVLQQNEELRRQLEGAAASRSSIPPAEAAAVCPIIRCRLEWGIQRGKAHWAEGLAALSALKQSLI